VSRQHPRSVYVRRWLLLLAAAILVAWVVVQVWPSGDDDANPTSTATVTALPPTGTPTPTPKPSTPPPGTTTRVALPAGTAACKTRDVMIAPSVTSPQLAQRPVFVDVAVSTSAGKPCIFTPKSLDPLAVVTQDDDTVWDSSICERAIVSKPVRLVPGWAVTIRVPWVPRESGDSCEPDEDWLEPDDYTLRVGTLGGEPGRADFTLKEPPPPPPKPSPTPVRPGSVTPVKPTPAPATPSPASPNPAG
jgi:hypothetical protein